MVKKLNWRLWVGFGFALLGLLAYTAWIMVFSLTKSIFWPSLALFFIAALFLTSGLRRASREPQLYRGKVAGPILTTVSAVILGLFTFASYQVFKNFPAADNAPSVGQHAPEFALVDTAGKNFSLSQLLATPMTDAAGVSRPAKGVLVFFYRGYW